MTHIRRHLTRMLTLFAVIFVAFSFTSCDDDDDYWGYDPSSAPFLGTWYGIDNSSSFVFDSDGWGTYTDMTGRSYNIQWEYDRYELEIEFPFDYGWDDYAPDDDWEFNWSMTGNILNLYDTTYGGTTSYTR